METRKLIKFGNSSHVLALPHQWLKDNKLNKGDIVYVSKNGNNELVITPERKEVRKELKVKNLDIDGKSIGRIKREVIAAYLSDFNIIKLHGKKVETEMVQIRQIIQDLIALEILEQNKNNVIARDFLNLENISIKKLVNKMDILSRAMFSDINFNINNNTCKNIINRDIDLNRIFFLAIRTINASLNNQELRTKLNYSLTDLFYYWHILYYVESVADKLKGVSWFFLNSKFNKKTQEKLFNIYKKIEKHYTQVMKVFYLRDLEKAYDLSDIKVDLIKDCDSILRKKNLNKIEVRILDKFKSIILNIHGIVREVYNNYS